MRAEVSSLVALGAMPAEADVDDMQVRRYQGAIECLPDLATREEIVALLDVFPQDDATFFGLAWSLLEYIEAAPGWPYPEALDARSWWVQLLRERAERGGQRPTR